MIREDADRLIQLDRFFREAETVTLVAHTHPDGDALGSGAALLHYLTECRGKDAALAFPNPEAATLSFILSPADRLRLFRYSEEKARTEARIAASDLIICLDCNSFQRTEEMEQPLRSASARKVLIDHHPEPDRAAFDLAFSRTDISSTCELLYEILMEMPDIRQDARRLPKKSAAALMTGMTTDTNNLANSVFPGTFSMASALLAAGVDRDGILNRLYSRFRENRLRLMGYFLQQMTITPCGAAYMVLRLDTQRKFGIQEGETEGFVNLPLSIRQVRMSLFLREQEGFYRVSIRSKRGVSAQRCAALHFHGGGHEQAAGGKLFFPGDIARKEEAASYIEKVTGSFFAKT